MHAQPAAIEDMRVDHGRRDLLVPEELLDGPNVIPCYEQVGGEAVAQRVWTDGFATPAWRAAACMAFCSTDS